jgi:hypothetical protein
MCHQPALSRMIAMLRSQRLFTTRHSVDAPCMMHLVDACLLWFHTELLFCLPHTPLVFPSPEVQRADEEERISKVPKPEIATGGEVAAQGAWP